MDQVRLNKYLAHTYGISRREADTAISQGRVQINGKIATLGNILTPSRDTVTFDKQTAPVTQKRYTYLLMNKPVGYVCSRKQQGENPTIYDLLPRQYKYLKVAGRLDKDSCGLLLLTDDGDTIFKLTHPKFGKAKVYRVALNKPLKSEDQKKIESGVKLEDGVSKLGVTKDKGYKTKDGAKPTSSELRVPNSYTITMYEGRNRQIRRTFKALGYTVTHLERIKLGSLALSRIGNQGHLILQSI